MFGREKLIKNRFNINQNNRMQLINKVRLISYLRVRQAIGVLAISIPITMAVSSKICGVPIKESISHYYFTSMGDVFVGLLFGMAMFLFSYKGYENKDNFITNMASIAAICVAIFPTFRELPIENSCRDCFYISCAECADKSIFKNIAGYIHFISAITFFVLLAIYTFFFFPKSEIETPKKKVRIFVYKASGVIMLLSLIWAYISSRLGQSIFWPETVCLFAFGVSWLLKGNMFYKAYTEKSIS